VTNHQGTANYNALQVSWNKQKGWAAFGLNYTFSKALGTCGTSQLNCSLADQTNVDHDYNVLSIDRSQVFNSSYQFYLGNRVHGNAVLEGVANGWTIAGITTLQSGPNLQATYNSNLSLAVDGFNGATVNNRTWLGTPDINLQPVLLCDPRSGLNQPHQYINGSCFGMPAQGTNGDYRFPYIHGPAYFNSDLSVYKTFKITERQNVEFRFSAFNFLNHPLTSFNSSNTSNLNLHFVQDGSGNFTQNNATFGIADVKYGRRVIDLALKYTF
jgi:hypothetical protein